jgi:hypothetical protein
MKDVLRFRNVYLLPKLLGEKIIWCQSFWRRGDIAYSQIISPSFASRHKCGLFYYYVEYDLDISQSLSEYTPRGCISDLAQIYIGLILTKLFTSNSLAGSCLKGCSHDDPQLTLQL